MHSTPARPPAAYDSATARFARTLFLAFMYIVVAAASFNAFYQKWGLHDVATNEKDARYTMPAMLEGTAHRPFVYRQLIPIAANLFDEALPPQTRDKIIRLLRFDQGALKTRLNIDPYSMYDYVLRYHFVYYACFGLFFLGLYAMRAVCLEVGFGRVAATLTPAVFALLLPFFETYGGFFYDFPEVFFLSTAFLLALRGNVLLLLPLTVLATLNKEAFFFFCISLFPLFLARYPLRTSVAITGLLLLVSGLTYTAIRFAYADNAGGAVESWIMASIEYYTDWRYLFQFEVTYGVVLPQGYSLFIFVLIGLVTWGGWRQLALPLRRHILLILAINLPLVLIFCGPGEMRNFSLCYMALVVLIGQNIANWVGAEALNRSGQAQAIPASPATVGKLQSQTSG